MKNLGSMEIKWNDMSMVLVFSLNHVLFAHAKSGNCFDCSIGFLIKCMGMKLGLLWVYYAKPWVDLYLKSNLCIFDGKRIILGGKMSQR